MGGTTSSQTEDTLVRLAVQPILEPPHPIQQAIEAKPLDLPVLRNPELLSSTVDPSLFGRSWQILSTRHRQRVIALISNQVSSMQKIMQLQAQRLETDVSKMFSPQFLAGLTVMSKQLQVRVSQHNILEQLEASKLEVEGLRSAVAMLQLSLDQLKIV
jgi:hypothetical protein